MSTATATLAAVLRVEQRLDRLERQLDAMQAARDPWPDRLRTSQATVYARCSAQTLYRWLRAGRLSDLGTPRRWLRSELDRCAAGDRPAPAAPIGIDDREHETLAAFYRAAAPRAGRRTRTPSKGGTP